MQASTCPLPCSSSSLLPGKCFQQTELLLRPICLHLQQGGKSPQIYGDTCVLCHCSPALPPCPPPFSPLRGLKQGKGKKMMGGRRGLQESVLAGCEHHWALQACRGLSAPGFGVSLCAQDLPSLSQLCVLEICIPFACLSLSSLSLLCCVSFAPLPHLCSPFRGATACSSVLAPPSILCVHLMCDHPYPEHAPSDLSHAPHPGLSHPTVLPRMHIRGFQQQQ